MSTRSLRPTPPGPLARRFEALEERLASGAALGPSHDVPLGVFVYLPGEELELRHQVELLATRLANRGRRVTTVDLGELLWACVDAHPAGAGALEEAEAFGTGIDALLREGHTLVAGAAGVGPGPLEGRVVERLAELDPERDVAFLMRAGELYPLYRTSALLERLMGHLPRPVPVLLFYPGTLKGATELRFMGVCEPSPNYRATIFA